MSKNYLDITDFSLCENNNGFLVGNGLKNMCGIIHTDIVATNLVRVKDKYFYKSDKYIYTLKDNRLLYFAPISFASPPTFAHFDYGQERITVVGSSNNGIIMQKSVTSQTYLCVNLVVNCNGALFSAKGRSLYFSNSTDQTIPFNDLETESLIIDSKYGEIKKLAVVDSDLFVICENGVIKVNYQGDLSSLKLTSTPIKCLPESVAQVDNGLVYYRNGAFYYYNGTEKLITDVSSYEFNIDFAEEYKDSYIASVTYPNGNTGIFTYSKGEYGLKNLVTYKYVGDGYVFDSLCNKVGILSDQSDLFSLSSVGSIVIKNVNVLGEKEVILESIEGYGKNTNVDVKVISNGKIRCANLLNKSKLMIKGKSFSFELKSKGIVHVDKIRLIYKEI